MSSLYIIGFIQTIFLAILIITKKKLKLSDLFLILFILIMGCRLLFIYFDELGLYNSYPQIIMMEFVYWTLFGPLLYLYISTVTSQNQKFRLVYLIHFIPALTVFIAFSGYITESGHLHFREYKQQGILFQTGIYIWFYTTHVYFILCIVKLHRYRRKVKHYFSCKKNIDLKWLIILTYGFGIFLIYSLLYMTTKIYYDVDIPYFGDHLKWLIMVVYIFGIGFFGFRQKGIFSIVETIPPEFNNTKHETGNQLISIQPKKKIKLTQYVKSKLDGAERTEILNKLLKHIKEEKPYLNSELDIRMLAGRLNTSPHNLSQVINTCLNKNFFEFINEYRIEEAKSFLRNPKYEHYKIMAIAYDCGFNSKSSFFSVFKKLTSQTPTNYKNNYLTA